MQNRKQKTEMTNTSLYIVVPCYNEQDIIKETAIILYNKISTLIENNKISSDSKILFVDDGSKDNTWQIIEELHKENQIFCGICLSRNKGHQNALLAGLMTAKDYADATISMDADLQDDVQTIDKMLDKYFEGYEVVYGVRSSRKKDTFFKRNSALIFYKIMKFLGTEIVCNHSDFRLMSKKSLEGLAEFKEINLFL